MGTKHPSDLLKEWIGEKLPVEMAVGHILQNLVKQQQSIEAHSRSLHHLRTDVDGLIAHTGTKPRSRGKNKPLKRS